MTQDKALAILQHGVNVFLTGEPGAGKTYTINLFIEWMKKVGKRYAVTASTGIAATHINGSTIHFWSGIGIKREITDEEMDKMYFNHFLRSRVKQTDVLIVDEISMLDATMIDNLDYVMRKLREDERPFGGLQVIFVGDFFQLPPVTKGEETRFAFEAGSWDAAGLIVCYLTEQHRQSDPVFLGILTAMRAGQVTEEHRKILIACQNTNPKATQLYTHNLDVENINRLELNKLPGKMEVFKAETGGIPFMVEILKKQCLSPDKLELKVGAVVMFTRNNFTEGYVNGTIGIVESFKHGLPVVKLDSGRLVIPSPAQWSIEEKKQIKAYFKQIPLRLAWAITVHKSQGMSLDAASMDLSRVFEYGQGYVAISRVRSLEGLHLKGMSKEAFITHPKIIEQDKEFKKQSEFPMIAHVEKIIKEGPDISDDDIPF